MKEREEKGMEGEGRKTGEQGRKEGWKDGRKEAKKEGSKNYRPVSLIDINEKALNIILANRR